MVDSSDYAQRYPSMVAAAFSNAWVARDAVRMLQHQGFVSEQIDLVEPGDPHLDEKLAPDAPGIGRAISHTLQIWGASGLLLGVAAALLTLASGDIAVDWSPYYTLLTFTLIGTFFGLTSGGVLALRPDHAHVINHVRDRLGLQQWVVLVHTRDRRESRHAREQIEGLHGRAVSSL